MSKKEKGRRGVKEDAALSDNRTGKDDNPVIKEELQSLEAEEALRRLNFELEQRVSERTVELRAASLYARNLIEAGLDPLVTISPEGRITDVNKATEQVTGRTRRELIGTDFSNYFTDSDAAQAGYQKVLAEGQVRDYPLTIRHTSGNTTDVLYNATVYRNQAGEVQGVFAAARDITERKQAELAVIKERQRFYDVLEALPAYVVLLTPDYHVPFANRFFRERFGESHGRCCYDYLFKREEPCKICETYTVLKTGKPHHWEWLGPDGRNYDIHDYPFTDTDGSPLIMEVGIDITEAKRAQAALKEVNETLEQRVAERTAELHESRRRLAVIVDSIADGFFAIDRGWHFTHINDAALSHFRKTRGEVVGRAFFEVFPEARSGIFETEYRRAMESGEPVHFESPSIISDLILEVHAYPGLETLTVLFRDITEKNRMAAALRKSEATLRGILDASKESIWLFSPDGNVIMSNETALVRFGKSVDDVIGKHFNEILNAELAKSRLAHLKEVVQSGRPVEFEDERSGIIFHHSFYPVTDADGRVNSIASFSRDVTERKQAEIDLQKAKDDLEERVRERTTELKSASLYARSLIEASLDPLVTINQEGKITDVNESTEVVTGRTKKELIGTDFSDYFTEPERARAGYEQVFREGFVKDYPLAIRHSTGRLTDVLYNASIYRDEGGAVKGVFAAARDVTELHRIQEALQKSHDELELRVRARTVELQERSEQLEAVNRELESFSYSVSHDLRAPLRAIDGYTRMILKKQGDSFDAETTRKFNAIRSNAQMMGQLIDDILSLSRVVKKHLSMSKLDMDAVVREVWKELEVINPERNMKLTVRSLPAAYGDRTLIKLVYFNLLANAVKFTKDRDPALIECGSYTEENEIVYYSKDNGVGFDMTYYDKLFGVFQRLHSADDYEGTGVGLATVHRIIGRHEGRVWAESTVGEGATFYFTLPKKG